MKIRKLPDFYSKFWNLMLTRAVSIVLLIATLSCAQNNDEWTVYNTSNSGLPFDGITVLDFDSQGNIWIGTGRWFALVGGGLAKFDGENWTVYNTSNSPLPNNDHFGLAVDPQGNIWSGTEGGLAKFDGTNWTVYKTNNSGLPNNRVATPVFDDQGNLWAGTWEGGLVKFDGVNWTVYNKSNSGLPNNIPFATAFDKKGNLWIGTVGGGLVKYDGTDWTLFNTSNSPLPHNTIFSICFDSLENLWIATDGGGLAKFDGTDWIIYNTSNSHLPSNRSWLVVVDAQDKKWIGTADNGMAIFDGKEWVVYNKSNSNLPDNSINYIAIDPQGKAWIATQNGGLAVYYPAKKMPIVDFNGDGIVDMKDLLKLIDSWGQNDPVSDIAPAPFGDGIVDALDLKLLMNYWKQPINDPTLITHWALDEAEGMIVSDSVGDNIGYAVGDPVWHPAGGQVDGAIEFDGIDDFISAPSVIDPSDGPFSILTWIKGGALEQAIVSEAGGPKWLSFDVLTGSLMTELAQSGRGSSPLLSDTIIVDSNWHRVGLTWDGLYRTIYIDDVIVAQDTQNGLQSPGNTLYIGCDDPTQPTTFFSGMIDDVRIYNRAVHP